MIERPQWLAMNQAGMGVGNGLDSANTYSVHKNIDSSSAAYNWIELANGLGKATVVDYYAVATQEMKLPFAFPFYGKTYTSLYTNWLGDVLLAPSKDALLSRQRFHLRLRQTELFPQLMRLYTDPTTGVSKNIRARYITTQIQINWWLNIIKWPRVIMAMSDVLTLKPSFIKTAG